MVSTRKKTFRQTRNVVETITTDLSGVYEELKNAEEQNEQSKYDNCFSVEEVCSKLGENQKNARDIIRNCIADGTCEYAGKRRGTGIDNRIIKTPVYRFKLKNNGKKKRK